MLSSIVLAPIVVVAIGALVASFFVIPMKEDVRRREHLARTLVAIGVGLVSVCVAIAAFNLKEQSESEHDRVVASLNFFKSMLQFGVTEKHMEYVAESCATTFDSDKCQERGGLAVRFSAALPGVDYIFGQVGRGAHNLAASSRFAAYLIDVDATLKSRMPTVITEGVQKIAAARPNTIAASKAQLHDLVNGFNTKAEEVSIIYCILADGAYKSWAAFDDSIKQLDGVLGAVANPDDQLRLVRRQAEKLNVAGVDCTKVRAAVDDLVPNGGGDGGN